MALSEELKRIYASNPTDNRFYETLQISHPNFTQDYYFVLDNNSHIWKNNNNIMVEFIPMNFSLVLPKKGDTQQEIQIQIDNTNLMLMNELNRALVNIDIPIKLINSVYINNETEPQGEVYDLELKNISANYHNITATATSVDMINIQFPKTKFDKRFKGLFL